MKAEEDSDDDELVVNPPGFDVESTGSDVESTGFEPVLADDWEDDGDWGTDRVWVGGNSGDEEWARNVAADPEITFQAIRDAQLADQTMALILELKERGEERPPWQDVSELPAALKGYWAQWNTLAVKKGVLVKRWESDDGREVRWLIVLPRGLRERVMEELHSSKTAGHLGRDKTLPKVRERYYWFGMGLDVRAFLRKCVGCAQKKGPPKKHRAPLQQYRVGAPLERVAIDVLGPLTETHQGNQYILVVGDYWTKWMEAYAMEDQQAETVAAKLVDEFVCRFGVPMELHSDQGRNFESAVFQEMCKLLGITKTRTTPYNPKSRRNGRAIQSHHRECRITDDPTT